MDRMRLPPTSKMKPINRNHMEYTTCGYPPAYGPWGFRRGYSDQGSGIPINIQEKENAFLLEVFAPGVAKENFSVSVKGDVLYVRFKGEGDASKGKFTRREYNPLELNRSFRLNDKVDVEKIQVSYREGILTVELPRKGHATA